MINILVYTKITFTIENIANIDSNRSLDFKKIIKRFISRMNKNGDPLKASQKEQIKLLFYNNRETIKKIIKELLNKINIKL